MDSRPVLRVKAPLGVLIDTASLDSLLSLSGEAESVRTFLDYQIAKHFKFVRSPTSTDHPRLNCIGCYSISQVADQQALAVAVPEEDGESTSAFAWNREAVALVAQTLETDLSASAEVDQPVTLAHVVAAMNRFENSWLLVTAHAGLLRKRLWLESHIPGGTLNIVTVQEAKEIMDLFAKRLGRYHISPNHYCQTGFGWYWYLFRSRIPHCHVENGILRSLANRLTSLLMSIDKMGFQYYAGIDNNSMMNLLYHFYYFIVLVTGTFDSLSIKTKLQYGLQFKDDNVPARTSLNNKAGREFLNSLRDKDKMLREHINHYVDFISLIYSLRVA